MITLERPLVAFDLECTGIDKENDRIVEFAIVKLDVDGTKVSKSYRVNPGIPIPAESSAIHGIYDKDVEGCSTFAQYAPKILKFIEGCDLLTFNGNNFDIPFIFYEFLRSGINWDYAAHKSVDAGTIFKIMEPRTLSAAVQKYCGREHDGAHGALADTVATLDVFMAQVEMYKDDEKFPKTIDELALFSNYGKKVADISGKFVYDENGVLLLNFGKYKGQPADTDITFLQWMLRSNFPSDTMKFCQQICDDYFQNES